MSENSYRRWLNGGRRPASAFDETFMELTLEDIQENIAAAVRSRAKRPKEWETVIAAPGRRITILVRTEAVG